MKYSDKQHSKNKRYENISDRLKTKTGKSNMLYF